MAKYDPLGRYLSSSGRLEFELSFAEIERILGTRLPDSASRPQWWANEESPSTRHVQLRAWRDAGYDAFLVDGADKIRFCKRAG